MLQSYLDRLTSMNGTFLMLTGTALLKHIALHLLADKHRRLTTTVRIGTLSRITMYPVKSMRGVNVGEARCETYGLVAQGGKLRDRSVMVCNDKYKMITGRQHPRLVLITTSVDDVGTLRLEAEGMQALRVPLNSLSAHNTVQTSVWGQLIEAIDCGDEASQWLCQYLNISSARLVYHSPDLPRRLCSEGETRWHRLAGPDDQVAFHDGFPIMMMSEASMAEMNSWLPEGKVADVGQFRPNFIISGSEAFDEDRWHELHIGDAVFVNIKPCSRYRMTEKELEPSPCMGINLVVQRTGNVNTAVHIGLSGIMFQSYLDCLSVSSMSGTFIALTTTAILKHIALHLLAEKHRHLTTKARIGTLSHIIMYPVKSMKALEVPEAQCESHGLVTQGGKLRDRSVMVCKSEYKMITAINHPRLVLITTSVDDEGTLRLEAEGMQALSVPLNSLSVENTIQTRVWGESIEGVDCGEEASAWLCQFLSASGIRLIYHSPALPRRKCLDGQTKWNKQAKPSDQVSYQDIFPVMMMSESSMERLNSWLPEGKVAKIDQFRPNFIISGSEAFDEDRWHELHIGDAVFINIRSCSRCINTTIDMQNGKMDEHREPLKTLKRFVQSMPTVKIFTNLKFPKVSAALLKPLDAVDIL